MNKYRYTMSQLYGLSGQVWVLNGWQNPSGNGSKWFINKNQTIYFWNKTDNTYSLNYPFDYFQNYSDSFKNTYNLSQDEIDQINKEIKAEQTQSPALGTLNTGNSPGNTTVASNPSTPWWFVNDPVIEYPGTSSKPETKNICNHDWKEYVGLNHTDTYCTKCPAKK